MQNLRSIELFIISVFIAGLLNITVVFANSNLNSTIPNFWDSRTSSERPSAFPDKIQFLATDKFPPFIFRDGSGRLTGFNVDLSRSICQELGASCSLRIVEFEALLPALANGEGDAIVAGLVPTSVLAEDHVFSADYLKLPARFIVRRQDAPSFDENALAGVRISVEAGSRHEAFALAFWPEALLLSFPDAKTAREALTKGEADAHFGDGMSLAFWLNSESAVSCCVFTGGPWLEPGYFDRGLSIAVRKESTDLADAINYALWTLSQNGKFKELYLRYFPMSFY